MATTLTLLEAARRHPELSTVATRDIPEPDFADVTLVELPPGAPTDPETWAKEIFAFATLPAWVRALMRTRQALVGLVGIERGRPSTFDIAERHDNEVLISEDANHLDMRLGIAVDRGVGLVRVTTVVREKGRRGRLYMRAIRVLHPAILRSMLDRTARRLAAPSGA